MRIPNLTQWLNNGGTLKIQGKDIHEVWIGIGDAGGTTSQTTVHSSEEAFKWAEAEAEESIKAHLEILGHYRSGEIPWPDDGTLKLPGIGLVYRDEKDA